MNYEVTYRNIELLVILDKNSMAQMRNDCTQKYRYTTSQKKPGKSIKSLTLLVLV